MCTTKLDVINFFTSTPYQRKSQGDEIQYTKKGTTGEDGRVKTMPTIKPLQARYCYLKGSIRTCQTTKWDLFLEINGFMLNVTDQYCISPATSKGGFSCHPGNLSRKCHLCHWSCKTRKRGTRPPSSHYKTVRTFLMATGFKIQDASDLSVSFALLGSYIPNITSSLR